MALYITQDLPRLVLTGSPAELKVRRTSYGDPVGTKAKVVYSFTSVQGNGSTMTVVYGSFSIPFTFSDAPDDSGFELPSGTGFANVKAWLIATAAAMNNCPAFFEYFVADVMPTTATTSGYLRIVAKNKGAQYTVDISGSVGALYNSVSGVDPSYPENHAINLYLYVEKEYMSGNFDQVYRGSGHGIYTESGNYIDVSFYDIPKVLDCYVEADLPVNVKEIYTCRHIVKRWYYAVSEQYGSTVTERQLHQSDIKYCLMGKMPEMQMPANFNFLLQMRTVASGGELRKPILSNWRKERFVDSKWQGWIGFLFNKYLDGNYFSLNLTEFLNYNIEVFFSDGTSSTLTKTIEGIGEELYLMPCGFEQWELGDIFEGNIITHWKVYCTVADVRITDDYVFIHDRRYFEKVEYYLWTNIFGALETLMNRGIDSKARAIDAKNYETILSESTTSERGLLQMQNRRGEDTLSKFTGFYSESWIDFLDEFIDSRNIFEIELPMQSNGLQRYKRMVQTKDKFRRKQEDDFLFGLEYELKYSMQNYASADKLKPAVINDNTGGETQYILYNNTNGPLTATIQHSGSNITTDIVGVASMSDAEVTRFENIDLPKGITVVKVKYDYLNQILLQPLLNPNITGEGLEILDINNIGQKSASFYFDKMFNVDQIIDEYLIKHEQLSSVSFNGSTISGYRIEKMLDGFLKTKQKTGAISSVQFQSDGTNGDMVRDRADDLRALGASVSIG